MKIEQQVCTLEQSQRLCELGVLYKGAGALAWVHNGAGWELFPRGYFLVDPEGGEEWPAFTVAEMGQMCNSETCTMRTGSEMSEYANWEWQHQGNDQAFGLFNTEAEARAALLIHLLETNQLTAEEANKRLMI